MSPDSSSRSLRKGLLEERWLNPTPGPGRYIIIYYKDIKIIYLLVGGVAQNLKDAKPRQLFHALY